MDPTQSQQTGRWRNALIALGIAAVATAAYFVMPRGTPTPAGKVVEPPPGKVAVEAPKPAPPDLTPAQEQERRDQIARTLDNRLIREGVDAKKVEARGTTLYLEFVFCGRPWLYRLRHGKGGDDLFLDMVEAGFDQISCTNGYDGTSLTLGLADWTDLGREER